MSDSLDRYIFPNSVFVQYSGSVYNKELEITDFGCDIIPELPEDVVCRGVVEIATNFNQYVLNSPNSLEVFRETAGDDLSRGPLEI